MPEKILLAATVLLLHSAFSNTLAQTPGIPGSFPPTEHQVASGSVSPADHAREQETFYDANQVQTIHLKITDLDQQKMRAALPECIYVPAQLRWNNQTLSQVGVRFKGNSSTNPNQKHKRSYLIKFSRYKKQQRFLGMERISLDNGIQFGSLFSEPIITDILQELGHKTHRCNFAKLYVNDQFAGVYVNAERIDDSFIDRHFSGEPGGLWKNDTGGPGGDLRYVGDDPKNYSKAFESKNKRAESEPEVRQLLALIKRINQVPDDEFKQMLTRNFDVDDFLQTTAVMLLSGAFDQLTGWGPHNYYLYRDPSSAEWHYLPWDLDVGFCEIAFGRVYVLEDWHAAWPVPLGVGNPLLERIIRDPALLERYRNHATRILETHFEPNRLCQKVDAKYALIRDALATDPFPKTRVTVPEDRNYDDIVESIKQFIHKRYQSAKSQLENPGSRPQAQQRNHGMPPQMSERLQKVTRKAEGIQRKLHEIKKAMHQISSLLQHGQHAEAERVLEALERLTSSDPTPQPER